VAYEPLLFINLIYEMRDMKYEESCGLFGIFGAPEAVQKTYFGLHSLQHRGQESAGIASSDGEVIQCYKAMGTVRRVFRSGSDMPIMVIL